MFFKRSKAVFDEVIVYQMGKVGSSSIVTSLNNHGVNTHQSHFLDSKTFHQTLDRIINSKAGEEATRHMFDQLQQNMMLANRLAQAMDQDSMKSKEFGIITLTRDPLDWFYSNLSQNYFIFQEMLEKWLGSIGMLGKGEAIGKEHLLHFVQEIVNRFHMLIQHMNSKSIEEIRRAHREANKSEEGRISNFVYGQATGLLRPHFWFDHHFKELFGVDVLNENISPGEVFKDKGENLSILLLRFEELSTSSTSIGEFCGIDNFNLKRVNVSKEKPLGRLFSEVRKEIEYPRGFLETIYSSRYSRKFYPEGLGEQT